MTQSAGTPAPVFRINKFQVPPEARHQFMEMIRDTFSILRRQQGFVRDMLMEQVAGNGLFNFVTIVEFADAAFAPAVAAAVAAEDARRGINREEVMALMGVRSDNGSYRPLAI